MNLLQSRRALLAGAPAAAAGALLAGTAVNALAGAPSVAKADGLDWPAIVVRAEGMIDRLRNYYANWTTADEEGAALVLKYCRNRLAGLPEDENETEFGAVVDFIEHHNQSLDWLFRGDPVTLITMMAARSSGALAGAGVERERSAYAAYLATDAVQDQVSDRCPFPERKLDRRGQKKLLARPEYKAWWARYQKAEKAHPEVAQTLWSARTDLLKTQPTSVPGLRAFIDHIEGPLSTGEAGEAFWDEQEREVAFPTLAAATRNIIARGQA